MIEKMHGKSVDNIYVFFNDTATTEIYTLSLHDALPIYALEHLKIEYDHTVRDPHGNIVQYLYGEDGIDPAKSDHGEAVNIDRKSTRLNSSHANISYAVFCLKKKKLLTFLVLCSSLTLYC